MIFGLFLTFSKKKWTIEKKMLVHFWLFIDNIHNRNISYKILKKLDQHLLFPWYFCVFFSTKQNTIKSNQIKPIKTKHIPNQPNPNQTYLIMRGVIVAGTDAISNQIKSNQSKPNFTNPNQIDRIMPGVVAGGADAKPNQTRTSFFKLM